MTEKLFADRFEAFDRNYQKIMEQVTRAAERSGDRKSVV